MMRLGNPSAERKAGAHHTPGTAFFFEADTRLLEWRLNNSYVESCVPLSFRVATFGLLGACGDCGEDRGSAGRSVPASQQVGVPGGAGK